MKTITDINGVFASGGACGIKPGRNDLAYIYVPSATACAGTFTRNSFRAPCVDFTAEQIAKGRVKAIIANAGNANAATGKQGHENAKETAAIAASLLGLSLDEVAVASTGIIGVQLPIDKIKAGLHQILADPRKKEGSVAAQTILTTDTRKKEVFLQREIAGKTVTISGITKGSGMIAPNMATMLAFLVTDANLTSNLFQKLLGEAVEHSFNMVSVDTDTSTNDMVLALSTGAIDLNFDSNDVSQQFLSLLTAACTKLAKMIAFDGEGATKLIEVEIKGAISLIAARRFAKLVVDSPLLKTAIHGADPNWGRALAALGKDPDFKVDPLQVELCFAQTCVYSKGEILSIDRKQLHQRLSENEVKVTINLNQGSAVATAWGCDLTKGYIDINTDYN